MDTSVDFESLKIKNVFDMGVYGPNKHSVLANLDSTLLRNFLYDVYPL